MPPTVVLPLPDPTLDSQRVGEWAVPFAQALATRQGSPITLVSVVERPVDVGVLSPGGNPEAERRQLSRLRAARHAYLEQVRDRFSGLAVRVVAPFGNVVAEVLRLLDEAVDPVLILAWRQRTGLDRIFIGSAAPQLVREAPCPVIVIRAPATQSSDPPEFIRVLVPLDGSAIAEQAIDVVPDILGGEGLQVRLLHVLSPLSTIPQRDRDRAEMKRRLLVLAKRVATWGGYATIEIRVGEPRQEISRAAEEWHADIIALTPHGRGGFKRLLLGSVAEGLLSGDGAPLLIARDGEQTSGASMSSGLPG